MALVIESFLNLISLSVRVLVLSEKIYITYPKSLLIIEVLALNRVFNFYSYILRSELRRKIYTSLIISILIYSERGTIIANIIMKPKNS